MMRILNIHGPDDVRVDSVAPPKVSPTDVLVGIKACGICGSDLKYIRLGGTRIRTATDKAPMPLGHEAAGIVIESGDAVEGINPGMRVIVNPMTADSVIGNGANEGAFADILLVRGAKLGVTLHKIPENLDFEIAALAEPLAVSRHAIHRGAVKSGDKAVVFGAGPIGLGIILWLKHLGLTDIISIDLSSNRLERARSLGATGTILAEQENIRECIAKLHGQKSTLGGKVVGTDVYFDVAGAPSIISDVVAIAKQDARLVIAAVYEKPVELNLSRFLTSEMHITSSMGYPSDFSDIIALLSGHSEEAKKMISHRLAFDNIMTGLDVARSMNSGKVMITFPALPLTIN
jgi:2-desacetyl-2-hydroxyethyl bacteriochlorophyllide A dehydrogenase